MKLGKDQSGFSLVEVLIAICVLSIALLGLATLQSRGIRSNDLANRTTQAAALAQIKLEEFIHRSASEVFAAGQTIDPDNPLDETGESGGIFSRSWEISDDTPVPYAQTVSVTVSWNDIVGQHNVTVSGVITSDSY
jgi:type IV pilus assembly protein PilV